MDLRDTIHGVLERNRLAVLSTQREGQPHASLMAFTPSGGIRFLAFATYRDTLKYESLQKDGRVAVLIEDRNGDATHPDRRLVLTALGEVSETTEEERQALIAKHLARHPDHAEFLRSPDCELVLVVIKAYQVVGGIDDVKWYHVGESAAT
jgi:nitroimidazol reductase NimA-like FMN-containing flavoprotein (pyridoxamine 5'-phosphate oxidase superfamily)